MSLPVVQSFAGIAVAEALDTFDARFSTIVGAFDGVLGGGALSTASDGNHLARVNSDAFPPAQYVRWTAGKVLAAGGATSSIGGALRMSGGASCYAAICNRTSMFLNRYTLGAFSAPFGSTQAAPAAGTVCTLLFGVGGDDTAWELRYDGVLIASGTDANLATGDVGIGGFNNLADGIGDYEAGAIVGGVLVPLIVAHLKQQGIS